MATISQAATSAAVETGILHRTAARNTEIAALNKTGTTQLRVYFDLSPSPEGTTLSLRQENLQTPEIYGHWNFYWNMALGRIKLLAETGKIG